MMLLHIEHLGTQKRKVENSNCYDGGSHNESTKRKIIRFAFCFRFNSTSSLLRKVQKRYNFLNFMKANILNQIIHTYDTIMQRLINIDPLSCFPKVYF
jgi:hypothetical protein